MSTRSISRSSATASPAGALSRSTRCSVIARLTSESVIRWPSTMAITRSMTSADAIEDVAGVDEAHHTDVLPDRHAQLGVQHDDGIAAEREAVAIDGFRRA